MLRLLFLNLLAAAFLCPAWAQEPAKMLAVRDVAGVTHRPFANSKTKACTLIFVLADCPLANSYAPEIKRLVGDYERREVAFFVVHVDPDITTEEAKKHAKEYGHPCPIAIDAKHELVELSGVRRAPEAAVFTPDGKRAYRGRIDNLYAALGKRRPEATTHDLRDALDAVLNGKAVANPQTDAVGCPIPRLRKAQAEQPAPKVVVRDADIPQGADGKKRVVSIEGAEYLQKLQKRTPFGEMEFDLNRLRAGMGTRREPTIKDVKLVRTKIDDIPCEWVLAPGADADVRLLYLHGGGFVSGSAAYYLRMAAHISKTARCAVLLPDYRLAPEHPFPAGVNDCVRAHDWMRSHAADGARPAKATFIAGDSAGGSLTLATLLALRDRKMPLPLGGIPLSATTDLTLQSESLRTVKDPIISARTMPIFREHYLGKQDPAQPLASPVFGDYRGIPPLLIQVGEHEMLRDDSIRVRDKARADGIEATLQVWPGMFHVFHSHEPLLPEAKEAIEHIAAFMRARQAKP